MKKQIKKKSGKQHRIYALYDQINDELAGVGLDLALMEMQLQLGDLNSDRFSIVEFDIRLI